MLRCIHSTVILVCSSRVRSYLSICSNTKLQVCYDYVTVWSIFQRSLLLKALRCFPLKYYFWLSQQRLFASLPFYFGHQNQPLSRNNPDFSQLPTTESCKATRSSDLVHLLPAICFLGFFCSFIEFLREMLKTRSWFVERVTLSNQSAPGWVCVSARNEPFHPSSHVGGFSLSAWS